MPGVEGSGGRTNKKEKRDWGPWNWLRGRSQEIALGKTLEVLYLFELKVLSGGDKGKKRRNEVFLRERC